VQLSEELAELELQAQLQALRSYELAAAAVVSMKEASHLADQAVVAMVQFQLQARSMQPLEL
jgi:hypothetical protein